MKTQKLTQRLLAMALSVTMVLGMTPVTTSANILTGDTGGEITAFERLEQETENQIVPLGTTIGELNLPDTLNATVLLKDMAENPDISGEDSLETPVAEDTLVENVLEEALPEKEMPEGSSLDMQNEEAAGSFALSLSTNGEEPVVSTIPAEPDMQINQPEENIVPIPVTWSAEPVFDEKIAGEYLFQPILPEQYTLAEGVVLPIINVTVGSMETALQSRPNTLNTPTTTYPRTNTLDLTVTDIFYNDAEGQPANQDPTLYDITNTGEGWTWYLNGDLTAGYSAKTLVLDGIDLNTEDAVGIKLPAGAIIVLAQGSENLVNITGTSHNDGTKGISGEGDLEVTGDAGSLQVVTGNTTETLNIGIFASENLIISGGQINVNVGTSGLSIYGIVSNEGRITISGGSIYSKTAPPSSMWGGSSAVYAYSGIIDDNMTVRQYVNGDYTGTVTKGPKSYLYNGTYASDLKILSNTSTEPTGPKQRSTELNLSGASLSYYNAAGSIVSADPTTVNITDTGEGWTWYLDGNTGAGYPEKTLVLDGIDILTNDLCGIRLPGDSTIILADGSSNDIINTGSPRDSYTFGIYSGGPLTVKGNGTLYITSGVANSYGSTGINTPTPFTLESGTIYIKLNGAAIQRLYTLSLPNINEGIKVYQKDTNGDYSIEATWNSGIVAYVYNGSTRATDVKVINGASLQPSAVTGNTTVTGTKGTPLSGSDSVTIMLTNDIFLNLTEREDVSGWFDNLPQGLTATVESINSDSSITISFSGTPGESSDEVMDIIIPADKLTGGENLSVTFNSNAKFDIAGPYQRTNQLDLTSNSLTYRNQNDILVNQNPMENNITDTAEGWNWYLYENEAEGYSARTLVLDGINLETEEASFGLKLPAGSTIILTEGSGNTVIGTSMGIWALGNLTIQGAGELHAESTMDGGGRIGIFCSSELKIIGSTVTASASDAATQSNGVFSNNTIRIVSGTLYAKASGSDSKAVYCGQGFPHKMIALQKLEDEYIRAVTISEDGKYYVYNMDIPATDLKITAQPPSPAAAVGNMTVSGIIGTPLSGINSVTITLTNDTFLNLHENEDASGWFNNLPQGLTATVESIGSDSSVTILFSGTPGETSDDVMEINIPAGKLNRGENLSVTANSNTKFDITEPATDLPTRNTMLDLDSASITYLNKRGNIVSANPKTSYIIDSDEGWNWYLTGYSPKGYPSKTLELNGMDLQVDKGLAMKLPPNTTIVLTDGSTNTVAGPVMGIWGLGDITMKGPGRLKVASTMPGASSLNSILCANLTINGGTIQAEVSVSSRQSRAIDAYSNNITNGTLYAKTGTGPECYAIYCRDGLPGTGLAVLQKLDGEYSLAVTKSADNHYYVDSANNPANDLKIKKTKSSVNNTAGAAAVTYSGTTVDLTAVSGLFSVDSNAGSRTYTVETGGTGAGTITGSLLTVTEAGTINIGLATAETATHMAGLKVISVLTVNKGTPGAPTGLDKTDAASYGGSDGKITGLTADKLYEYKKDGGFYVAVTTNASGEITGLLAGTYVVRLAGNDLYSAGEDSAAVIIGQPNRDNGGNPGGSPGGTSGGSTGGGLNGTETSVNPTVPVTGTSEIKAVVDNKGNASTTVTDKNITDAIVNAKAEAEKKGVKAGEITVSINVSTAGKGSNKVTVNLPITTQQQIINNKITEVKLIIEHPDIVIGLGNAAVNEINRQANADVQLTATKSNSTKLGKTAKKAIGSRPVYDFKANYQGGKGSVKDFGKGAVYVSIPYTPAKNEKVGFLYAVYVDSKGKVSRVPGSAYDVNTQSLIFTTNHFSTYGISYTDPAVQLTDTASHWAKNSIDYVVGRRLLSGTSKTKFSPNADITRGMLVTALGRLEGIDVNSYNSNTFNDVKADSAYRPYIEWANSKGIIKGIGNEQFAPGRAITREEVAVIFVNYANIFGYTLPVIREAAAYADDSSIGSSYKDAVKAMQQSGIMMGGTGNKFNPRSNATRAEISSMLHRYVKLTIDSATAQGWTLNDAGQVLYYKDGILAAGKWLEIDSKWYYFYSDGSLAKNTTIEGHEIDQYGVRKEK